MARAQCSIDGCEKPGVARGWCEMHYTRWRNHGSTEVVLQPAGKFRPDICTVETCGRPQFARDLCTAHYNRWFKTGDVRPDIPIRRKRTTQPFAEFFWSRVDRSDPDGCWPWMGPRLKAGYGNTHPPEGGSVLAHRVAYQLTHGPIPERHFVCHRCDYPPCCRPDHLFVGTPTDNVRDAVQKKRMLGNRTRGTQRSTAKLTPEMVRQIRELYAPRRVTYKHLGAMFSVHPSIIKAVVLKKRYTEVQ